MNRATHRSRRLRGLAYFVACIALVAVIAIAALPAWLPWVLKPVGHKQGVVFSNYIRRGYSAAQLKSVTYTNSAISFRAESVDFTTPTVWLWDIQRGGHRTFLAARNWSLVLHAGEKAGAPRKPESSTHAVITNIQAALQELRHWVPAAELENGQIVANGVAIWIPRLVITNGTATGQLRFPRQNQTADVTLNYARPAATSARIKLPQLESENLLTISADGTGATIGATNRLGTNSWTAAVEFAQDGQIPRKARIDSERMVVPASFIGMPQYSNTTAEIHGSFEEGRFEVAIRAHSDATLRTASTALDLELRARGSTNEAMVEVANVSSDWFRAALSTNARVYFTKPYVRNPARFTVTADLSAQSTIPATGRIVGSAELLPRNAPLPLVQYDVRCENVAFQKWHFEKGTLMGALKWPMLEVMEFKTVLTNGLALAASGSVDLKSRAVSEAKVELKGNAPTDLLPHDVTAGKIEASIVAHGSLTNLSYAGSAKVAELVLPGVKPITVAARWNGEGEHDVAFKVSGATSNGEAAVTGTIQALRPDLNLTLQTFVLTTNGVTALTAKSPAVILISKQGGGAFSGIISNLMIAGPGGKIEAQANVHWPENGGVRLDVSDVGSEIANSFLSRPVESGNIGHFHAEAGWSNGPIHMAVTGSVGSPGMPFRVKSITNLQSIGPLAASIDVRADETGLTVSNLLVSARNSPVLTASGRVPVTLTPGPQGLQFLTNEPIAFSIESSSNSVFWDQIAEFARAKISRPSLNVKVSGSWQAPSGVVQFHAARIQPPAFDGNRVTVSNLNLDLALDRSSAVLTNCSFFVEGQAVRFQGALPLDDAFWARVNSGKLPDFGKANGSARFDGAEIAAFAPLFPKLLAPQGTFSADIALRPGMDVAGSFVLKNARTRPLPSIGPIRDIDMRLNLAHGKVEIPGATVRIGGAAVVATGTAVVPKAFSKNTLPESFQVVIRGTNVPLSRQPSSIIRADLNLSIQKTNAQPPLIAGTVNLRDSFYLSDVTALIPGKTASVSRRPPYFSIEDPALAPWRIDLHVTGEQSLKVRSTLFNGTTDPNLRIEGTLRDPVAVGDVRIDEGLVRFPFASLDVQQGFVALTRADPFRPRIELTATSRRFGYDVRMRLSGPVEQPVIEFSSTPPLSSDELLLMVTAGELPRGGYTLTPQQRAQTVALFLGKDLLAKLGMGDSTTQRLTITSGEDISEAGKPTYGVDYKLTKRWSLEGEYDRFNAFNAGLKWKVYSK